MKKLLLKKESVIFVVFLLLLFSVFFKWFSLSIITAGDFWPLYTEQYSFYTLTPYAWSSLVGYGLGGNAFYAFWNYILYSYPIIIFGKYLQLSYPLVERLSFLFPLLILLVVSSYVWARYFFKDNIWAIFLSMFIFVFNTYALMAITGGQMGIAFAYATSPLVFYFFIKCFHKRNYFSVFDSVLFGLLLAILISFDLRIAYIVMLGISVVWVFYQFYYVLQNKSKISISRNLFYSTASIFIFPGIIVLGLHAFWIFPIILSHVDPVTSMGNAYTSINAVKFLSFAKFENTFSLLHPNWPENIFGKVYFMRPEFLLYPILAFSGLLFIKREKDNYKRFIMLVLSFIALLGAFLAKGSNPPLGEIYLWFFDHFPGFILFRDATKFYVLIALCYSILIPYVLVCFTEYFNRKKNYKREIFWLGISFLFVLMILPKTVTVTTGILKSVEIPQEYIRLKNILAKDSQFSRTFWIPQLQRFGYYSPTHPTMQGGVIFNKSDAIDIVRILQGKDKNIQNAQVLLERWSVKYVIVPHDSEGEIFLEDRKYNSSERKLLEKELDTISWLQKMPQFNAISVYRVSQPKDHLFLQSMHDTESISYSMNNPTSYNVIVSGNSPVEVVFSESFDKNWVARKENIQIKSQPTEDNLNSFSLTEGGEYIIEYTPQKYVTYFFIFSLCFLLGIVLILLYKYKNR